MAHSSADAPTRNSVLERALRDQGGIEPASLERARRVSEETGQALDVVLTRLGLATEAVIARALASRLDLPLIGRGDFPEVPVLADRLGPQFLRQARVLPIAETETAVTLAMADPLDGFTVDAVRLRVGKEVMVQVAPATDIEAAINELYAAERAAVPEADRAEVDHRTTEEDIARLRDLASEAPVVRLVSRLINRAVEAGASDIHVEPFENVLKVRYRIDGVLRDVETPALGLRAAITSRIKLMARLNIAESRLPQDGRIQTEVRGRNIDLRVSTVPTLYGESVVLRILDRGAVSLDLGALGFGAQSLKDYLRILDMPTGIVLVTGPTGSGKTTTLYSSLVRLNTGDRKILTVEDPVEYRLDGVNQVQVRPQIGLTFAHTLRSLLRQDPDVLMIGEIRDLETAEIAIQSALTGHKVLSTLHTNSAAGTVTRLLDMGVEDYLLTSTINGLVGQRLVRRVCANCRADDPVLPEVAAELRLDAVLAGAPVHFAKGSGCDACRGTGYKGRTTIVEVMPMRDGVARATVARADARTIERAAIDDGMITMFADGVRKAAAGVTTLDEVLRVTREA